MKWLAILLLAGCTTIDTSRPPAPDWPKLKETVHLVSPQVMGEECAKLGVGGFGAIPFACTNVNFDTMTCTTWLAYEANREHEHMHCLGYDHPGESAYHDYWQRWKAAHK